MATVRKVRGAWCADYRDQHGRRRIEASQDGTKRGAELLLAGRIGQVERGEHVSKREQLSVEGLCTRYLEAKNGKVRENTLVGYRELIDNYIVPRFGHLKLQALTVAAVERFRGELTKGMPEMLVEARAQRYAQKSAQRAAKLNRPELARKAEYFRERLAKAKIGTRSVNKILTLLSMLYGYAARHRWVSFNPAEHVDKLSATVGEGRPIDGNVLNAQEVTKLIEHCSPRYQLLIKMAVMTGMRQSELLGAAWTDVDWNSNTLYVRRVWRAKAFYEPKTRTSRRLIELPPSLITDLKAWRLAVPKGDHDLIFPSATGRPEDAPNVLHRGLYPALRRAGLRKIRFHDLRHSAASLLLSQGVDVVSVSRLLGHSSPAITLNVYSHAIRSDRAGLTDKLASMFAGQIAPMESPAAKSGNILETSGPKSVRMSNRLADKSLMQLAPRVGLEPTTNGLTVRRSTN
jgi:integrase